MKEGWKYSQLGSICKIYNGNSVNADYKKSHYTNLHDGYPFIATKDVSFDGYISYNNGVKIPYNEGFKVAKPGSVFICAEGGSAGKKIGYVEREVCFGNKLFCLEPFNNLIGTYLYYFLRSNIFQNQFAERLSGLIGGVSAKKFSDITVLFPSLHEQQRIVEYLDSTFAEIDALKAKAAEEVANAKAMFDAALREEMTPKEGWEEKTLGEVSSRISDGSHNPPNGLESSQYIMLSSKNIRNDHFSFTNPRYLREVDFIKENKRTDVKKGDVLLTIVGAGLGECCTYPVEEAIVFQRSVAVIKPIYDIINNRFLMYHLQASYDKLISQSNGAAQKGIYLNQLKNFECVIPQLTEQQRIVARLDTLRAHVTSLEQKYAKIAAECDALKQAILREIFE